MRKFSSPLTTLIAIVAAGSVSGCGYNKLQGQDEAVKAAWSEVVNQYQRRADLIPNLVATVRGFAVQEERVLVGVTEARARATSIQLTPELLADAEAFKKFQAAQGELTQALKSLIAVTENYPDLKSDANFRDLQVQLEGKQAPSIDGFTGDQRFFLGWAQVWRRKYRDQELLKRLVTDPHSFSEFRTNGPTINIDGFYDAFDVKPGDRMYRPAAERVRIW